MPISDATAERFKRIEEIISYVIQQFNVPRAEAWQYVHANGLYKIAERAERMDERSRKNLLAKLHADAAAVATQKAQIDTED